MCLIIIIKLRVLYYKMNDTISLLLATGILAVGGLGLFMYKNSSENVVSFLEEDSEKKDENWFDLRSFFGNSNKNDEDLSNDEDDDDEIEVYETKSKSRGSKTKSVRKSGGTKRRY